MKMKSYVIEMQCGLAKMQDFISYFKLTGHARSDIKSWITQLLGFVISSTMGGTFLFFEAEFSSSSKEFLLRYFCRIGATSGKSDKPTEMDSFSFQPVF
jgi:hypothetical protein